MIKSRIIRTLSDDFAVGEINNEPSLTVPDMALTPKQILERFTSGRSVAVSPNMFYHGDEDLPDFRSLDLVDIEKMSHDVQKDINYLSYKLQELKDVKAKKNAPASDDVAGNS